MWCSYRRHTKCDPWNLYLTWKYYYVKQTFILADGLVLLDFGAKTFICRSYRRHTKCATRYLGVGSKELGKMPAYKGKFPATRLVDVVSRDEEIVTSYIFWVSSITPMPYTSIKSNIELLHSYRIHTACTTPYGLWIRYPSGVQYLHQCHITWSLSLPQKYRYVHVWFDVFTWYRSSS